MLIVMNKNLALGERYSIVVATPHNLDMWSDTIKHTYVAPPRTPEGQLDYSRIIRAQESKRPEALLQVELSDGQLHGMVLYELSHSGEVQRPDDIRKLLGGLGVSQCVAVSRMGGRFLGSLDLPVQGKYCHPAQIIRNQQDGAPIAARQFAMPQPTEFKGDPDFVRINQARHLTHKPYYLLNYYPQDMAFWDGHASVELPRHGAPIDIEYDYVLIGETEEGIPLSQSRPCKMPDAQIAKNAARNTLLLVHWEALIEGLRLGALSVEEASRLVFPLGVGRRPDGQQGSIFSALGYYSPDTLRRIFYQVKT